MRSILGAVAAVAFLAVPALAHPDEHDQQYRVERKPIGQSAQEAVIKLVAQAKLPASWSKAKPLDTKMRTKDGAEQWVVTFRNGQIRNSAKRNLYVIMNTEGGFISANHKLS